VIKDAGAGNFVGAGGPPVQAQQRQPGTWRSPSRSASVPPLAMGDRNPDRVPLSYRRAPCETVTQMLHQRWEVTACCRTCRLELRVVRRFARANQTGREKLA